MLDLYRRVTGKELDLKDKARRPFTSGLSLPAFSFRPFYSRLVARAFASRPFAPSKLAPVRWYQIASTPPEPAPVRLAAFALLRWPPLGLAARGISFRLPASGASVAAHLGRVRLVGRRIRPRRRSSSEAGSCPLGWPQHIGCGAWSAGVVGPSEGCLALRTRRCEPLAKEGS